MNDLMSCGYCGTNFWPETGHSCQKARIGDVPPRPGVYQPVPVSADDIRRIIREELDRSPPTTSGQIS